MNMHEKSEIKPGCFTPESAFFFFYLQQDQKA
jgi:hypothetical protein